MRRKIKQALSILLSFAMLCGLMPVVAMADTPDPTVIGAVNPGIKSENIGSSDKSELKEYQLVRGINLITESATNSVFTLDIDKVAAIKNVNNDNEPLVFENCLFEISGTTGYINDSGVGRKGATKTKIGIGENIQFNHCSFIADNVLTNWGNGNDACIQMFSPDVVFNDCIITGTGCTGQFLGFYDDANTIFNRSEISTIGNLDGWSYAMYNTCSFTLNDSVMSAAGTIKISNGSTTVFAAGQETASDPCTVNLNHSTIDFHDNAASGIVLRYSTINIKDGSLVSVCDNSGYGTNTGIWNVENSTVRMNGNGAHGLSHDKDTFVNSKLELLHNGYAGYYVNSDSSMTGTTVDIRCNGEKRLNYSAGDTWINTHTLTLTNCTSEAQPGSAWIGAVGRKGSIITPEGSSVVAYDLNDNAIDNLKSNTLPTLTNANIALNTEKDKHTLFLNPKMKSYYARGNTEGRTDVFASNDADLFVDLTKEVAIGKDTAVIGTLTTAQLSHHNYDWDNGVVTDQATADTYGVKKYSCTDVCGDYTDWTNKHPHSFDCAGTYVYAPLVGLVFDGNVKDNSVSTEPVTNIPAGKTDLEYGSTFPEPTTEPVREGYIFTGWYTDSKCKELFDFSTELTANYTVLYAGWKNAGSLHIAKAVTGEAENVSTAETFRFDVSLNNADGAPVTGTFATVRGESREDGTITFNNGTAQIDLKGGEDIIIKGISAGTGFTVSEDEVAMPSDFEFENAYLNTVKQRSSIVSGSIDAGKESFVLFENKVKERASLIIVKHLTSDTELSTSPAFKFNVTATLNGQAVSGDFTAVVDNSEETISFSDNGSAVVTVKADSFKTITGFPIGTVFTVEEILPDEEGYELIEEKSVTANNTTYADFTNSYTKPEPPVEEKTGSITIKKTVSDGVSTTSDFKFTITLSDKTINGTYGDLTFTDGKADFTLKADESKTAKEIPVGVIYTVTENETAYTITKTNAEGTVSENGVTATFNNAKKTSSGGGGGGGGGGSTIVNPKPDEIPAETPVDTGDLNKDDHYAYIVGRPDGYVYPNTEITRAEVATIFYRLLTEDARKELWTKSNPYPDVELEDWYNVAISVMSKGGVVHGYPDGKFRPDNSITRAEFATIAAQFLSSEYVGENRFSDIDSHWAAQYINRAAAEGWIAGYPDGTFKPDQNITRAEAMTLVNAVLERTPDKTKLLDDMIKWPDNMDTTAWYYAQVQEATNSHEYDRETKETAENWTEVLPVRDWVQIERSWSDIYSSVNPGEVMD